MRKGFVFEGVIRSQSGNAMFAWWYVQDLTSVGWLSVLVALSGWARKVAPGVAPRSHGQEETFSALGSGSSVFVSKAGLFLKDVAKWAGLGGEEGFRLSHGWGKVSNIGCRAYGGRTE